MTTTPPRPAQIRVGQARILHGVLAGGVVLVGVVLGVARQVTPVPPLQGSIHTMLALAAVAVGVTGAVAIMALRRTVPEPHSGERFEAWWGRGGSHVVILWVLAEGLGVIGAVFWFVTGDPAFYAVMGAVSLVLLVVFRPGAVAGT